MDVEEMEGTEEGRERMNVDEWEIRVLQKTTEKG